jgi:protein SCO1/2/putative membrane protein
VNPKALRVIFFAVLIMPVLGVLTLAAARLSDAWRRRLPVFGQVATFSLIESNGKTLTSAALSGKPWVASFIFTRCAGSCPVMTHRMARLQTETSAQFVSFTVDPAHDTPAVLANYAEQYGADRSRWWFLTGDREQIFRASHSMFLAVDDTAGTVEEPILHSTKFVLVDQKGNIRGYYDGTDVQALEQLIRDARSLQAIGKLPAVNATLNGVSGLVLLVGYVLIRRRLIGPHLVCMSVALVVSLAFLVCYLLYHYHVGVTRFPGHGLIRPVYFSILISHTILAGLVAFALAPVTVYRAARRRFDRHKLIARWTLPIWFYVSVTGVMIYFMLYHSASLREK